jgi:drug/metabolite transporter (DMT)-like permease
VLAGVLVALGAACCYEIAYVLQALEARGQPVEQGLRASLLGSLIRNPRWAGATVLSLVAALLQLWAFALAPVTVVQPMLALGLLALPLLARFVLGEHLRTSEFIGVAAIVGGVSVIALFGPTHVGRRDGGVGLVVELVALGLVLLAPFALRGQRRPAQLAVFGAAAGDVVAALALKLAADRLHDSAILPAVLLLGLAAGSGALALTAEMTALQRLRATEIAPVVVAFQVLVPVATGLAFLGDSWRHTPAGGVLLSLALAVLLAGAALLASSRSVEEALGVVPQDDLGGAGQRGK